MLPPEAGSLVSVRDGALSATDVVTLGETMILLDATSSGLLRHSNTLRLSVGGSESNVAIGLRRLGTRATWIGRVGADEFGERVLSSLRGEDVDVHAIRDPTANTGLMIKEHRNSELGRVWYYRAASAGSLLNPDDVDENLIRDARLLHLTGITPALSVGAAAAVEYAVAVAWAAGVPISVDLNYRRALWSPAAFGEAMRSLVDRASIVFGSLREVAHTVGGEVAEDEQGMEYQIKSLLALGPEQVVLKLGAQGAAALVGGRIEHVPAYPVQVIDSVGAGDAFVAGWLNGMLAGLNEMDCLLRAAVCGALACTATGDWEGTPTAEEVRDLLAGRDDPVLR